MSARRGPLFVVLGAPNPRTLQTAVDRLGVGDETVTLMSVVSPPPDAQRDLRLPDVDETVAEALVRVRTAKLQKLSDAVACNSRVRVECGEIAPVVVGAVEDEGFGPVVAVSDDSDAAAVTIGQLIVVCPGEVFVQREFGGPSEADVLVAINPDDDAGLNRAIVNRAVELADRAGGEVHIAHAWQLYGEAELLSSNGKSAQAIGQFAAAVEAAQQVAFDALVRELGVDGPAHLVQGEPGDVVARLVDLYHVGIVVMGTAGRVGIHSILTHSYAREIVERVGCGVFILKPAGFESPLRNDDSS